MVRINLWPPRPEIGPQPLGLVHIACGSESPRSPAKWREAESTEAPDRMFPDRTLYWCTLSNCFGPNPRGFPRYLLR